MSNGFCFQKIIFTLHGFFVRNNQRLAVRLCGAFDSGVFYTYVGSMSRYGNSGVFLYTHVTMSQVWTFAILNCQCVPIYRNIKQNKGVGIFRVQGFRLRVPTLRHFHIIVSRLRGFASVAYKMTIDHPPIN